MSMIISSGQLITISPVQLTTMQENSRVGNNYLSTMALWIMRHLAILPLLFFLLSVCTAGNKEKNTFNIILITIDALRADHLSCYGYHRKTTPAIDKIAEQAIIYSNAIAPSSWTLPSLASLFTSVYPSNHGVVHDPRHKKDPSHALGETFSEQLTTLAEALKAQGYTTFAVASNPHLHKASVKILGTLFLRTT
jgi:glucan phosphoethanolaminetransferase (alkaline phosphatase superfamily)